MRAIEKTYLRAIALENLLVHLVIARTVAGVATGRIDDDRAAGRARGGIEQNISAGRPEGSVNRVQRRV